MDEQQLKSLFVSQSLIPRLPRTSYPDDEHDLTVLFL